MQQSKNLIKSKIGKNLAGDQCAVVKIYSVDSFSEIGRSSLTTSPHRFLLSDQLHPFSGLVFDQDPTTCSNSCLRWVYLVTLLHVFRDSLSQEVMISGSVCSEMLMYFSCTLRFSSTNGSPCIWTTMSNGKKMINVLTIMSQKPWKPFTVTKLMQMAIVGSIFKGQP